MKKMLCMVAAAALLSGADACIDPMSPYSVGIVFSDGEKLQLDKIVQPGTDPKSYIRECTDAAETLPVIKGGVEGKPSDALSIDSASITGNILTIGVSYGGGCKDHEIQLYWDGAVMLSLPGQINLMLTHDNQDDMCKAIVSTTLKFDLTGIDAQEIQVNVYAPGANEAAKKLMWTPSAQSAPCSYKFRSAFSPDVMVYAGPFKRMFSGEDASANQLLLIFDTASVPSKETKVEALLAEITRLSGMGVISLSKTQIGSLGTKLRAAEGQYWTKEDTVLGFNMWFNGVAVDGVRGVYAAKGCGSGIAYELPAKPLQPTAVHAPLAMNAPVNTTFSVHVDKSAIVVRMSRFTSGTSIKITDMHGRLLTAAPLVSSSVTVPAGKLASGCYLVSLATGGNVISSHMITVP